MDLNLDQIISDLETGKHMKESELIKLLEKIKDLLIKEDNLLYIPFPIIVVGDIHGQLFDLLSLFEKSEKEWKNKNIKENITYLFLGDYVDRGHYSIETFALLGAKKLKNPNQFYLLRGNHESRSTNQMYGLSSQCTELYGNIAVWHLLNDIFDCLPLAAILGNKIFCCHGGLSPELSIVQKIYTLDRKVDLPQEGLLADLTWSDPGEVKEWLKNRRGSGYMFGKVHVEAFLKNNQLDFMVRSHQLMKDGYFSHFDGLCYTVWSAPNYAYIEKNKATFLLFNITENNSYIFEFIEFENKEERPPPDYFEGEPCPYFA